MLGVAALAAYALVDKMPVMFVSAIMIGIIVYVFRRARTRDRIIAIVAAGLAGSIGAEIAMTIYRHTGASESSAALDGGGPFMMAMLLGVINAAAIIILVAITEIVMKYADRQLG